MKSQEDNNYIKNSIYTGRLMFSKVVNCGDIRLSNNESMQYTWLRHWFHLLVWIFKI